MNPIMTMLLISADNNKIIEGNLTLSNNAAKGIVIFVHGGGGSRHSARNKYVAQVLGMQVLRMR